MPTSTTTSFVLGIALQHVQQAVGLGLGFFLRPFRFASEGAVIADEDMAGLQRVGTVLLVHDADEADAFAILIRAINEAYAILALEDDLFDLLRNVLDAHPSAVVALVGIGIDEVNHVFRVLEV